MVYPPECGAIFSSRALHRAAGAVVFAVTASDELWQRLRDHFVRSGGWSEPIARKISVLLRCFLNTELAKERNALYAPAVSRSVLLRSMRAQIVDRILSDLSKSVSSAALRYKPAVQAPSLEHALVVGSNGHPEAVLYGALQMREKAAPLRSHIRKLVEDLAQGTPDALWRHEARTADLSRVLEQELGLRPRPALRDAIDIDLVLGVAPLPKVSGKGLAEWIGYLVKRRRVAVPTDLSKALVVGASQPDLASEQGVLECELRNPAELPDLCSRHDSPS